MTTTTSEPLRADPPGTDLRFASTLVAVLAASILLPFAVTGPAVVLPQLAAGLHAGAAATQWVQNAYNATFAAAVLAAGSLADRLGRRRVLRTGIVVFALAAAGIAASPDVLLVDVLRGVQGVGAAGIIAGGAAVLAHATSGPRRILAFGLLGAAFGAGLAFGPLGAGALGALGWRWVFAAIAVVAVAALAVSRSITESRDADAPGLDLAGMSMFGAALLLLSCAFVRAGGAGWTDAVTLLLFVAVGVLLMLFVLVELRSDVAMFDVRLFRRPAFTAVICQPFAVTFGFVILLVYLPVYLQGVEHLSPLGGAMVLLPVTVPVLVVPLAAPWLTARLSVRTILVVGSLLTAAGSAGLLVLEPGGSPWRIAGPLLVFGAGVGTAFAVMDNAAVSTVPVSKAGAAAGMFNTMRIAGESLAVAAAAAVLASLTARRSGPARAGDALRGVVGDQATAAAFTDSLRVVFAALAVLALVGALLTARALREGDT